METRGRWLWWLRRIVVAAAVSAWWQQANSEPQINLLNRGCSQYNATNTADFFNNLNATFSGLRTRLSGGGRRFATAEQARSSDPVYAMVQCRNYMSGPDCLACYDAAVAQIRNCSAANGARVIYDGCFLRYESNNFYDQTTLPGNVQICGNRTASQPAAFNAEAQTLLRDLETATPRINGYFAASTRQVSNLTVYGVAQCAETITQSGCRDCLAVAHGNIQGCLPNGDGRAIDAAYNILGATQLQGPNIYSYKDLKTATNNFSEENKLGEGGFGDVFKATLKNGNIVAVKKLDISYSRAKADFETEVRLISNVHHRNLVRLLGCCSKGSELLLVYEYMANGSLDRFLYGDKRGSLTWKQRFDIIFGTARGLAYLHEQYHVCIIHRDIKPSNILLDDEFQAKIADFGLARLLPENQSHVSTKFAGTLGYTAPEYAVHGHLSEKVDTYSFGVVILEIISGRRSSDMNADSDTEYLLEEAWKLYESGMHQKLADEALDSNEFKPEELKKMIEIALVCTQSPPSSRPTMSEILVTLLSDRSVEQQAPTRPSFSYANRVLVETTSVSTGSSTSNATASISQFTGR
ncbi:hypothetical protein DH2020_038819 [Rehmannia glutinosa]|uniref:Cysteine-rich receptor-like protein kinase n=1 Tax=Rehmannia glutinosa TaxID=99300 RepID=A0ABR0UXI8_REHGL